MQGAKSENSSLFKDFCNDAEMGKNTQMVDFIFTSSLKDISTELNEGSYHNGIADVIRLVAKKL